MQSPQVIFALWIFLIPGRLFFQSLCFSKFLAGSLVLQAETHLPERVRAKGIRSCQAFDRIVWQSFASVPFFLALLNA